MNRQLRIRVFDRLATMLGAGIPLHQAVEKVLASNPASELRVLLHQLLQGDRAAEAFAAAGFEEFEQNLVNAGERGGRLDDVFRALSLYYQRELAVSRAIKTALVYPISVLNLIALIGPLPELVLKSVWSYLASALTSLFVIWSLLIGVYVLVRSTWNLEAAQFFWLRLPLVGGFLRATYQYRWIVALRIELNAGIGFAPAAADAWAATGFARRTDRAREVVARLQEGERLSTAMVGWPELPSDWAEYMATAEESGKIVETLGQLEALALDNWKHAQDVLARGMSTFLYFALILAAGFFVFTFVVDRFSPVLKMLDQM
ncbi:MAG: type II secretion system F family protein [Verrucomicrobiota bacterium]